MSEYSKSQSTVIALWVLALQNKRSGVDFESKGSTAPRSITDLVNSLGEIHTSDSILLHTHGYDRLLLGRPIDRAITKLQREIAQDLLEQGVISQIYTLQLSARSIQSRK